MPPTVKSPLPFTAFIKSHGYNKLQLAQAIGIPAGKVTMRATGRAPWRLDEAARAAAVLGVSLDEFAKYAL